MVRLRRWLFPWVSFLPYFSIIFFKFYPEIKATLPRPVNQKAKAASDPFFRVEIKCDFTNENFIFGSIEPKKTLILSLQITLTWRSNWIILRCFARTRASTLKWRSTTSGRCPFTNQNSARTIPTSPRRRTTWRRPTSSRESTRRPRFCTSRCEPEWLFF